MIAVDTSSLVAFLSGEAGPDVDLIKQAFSATTLALPPPVVTELCARSSGGPADAVLAASTQLALSDGHWVRAGVCRGLLLSKGFKAKFADVLIAQCCIDADVELITRDEDFRHFAKHCGLKLAA